MEDATTTTGRGGNKRSALKVALIVTGELVLAGAAAAGVWRWQQRKDDGHSAQPDPMTQTAEQVQNDIISGEYDKAHEMINKALDSPDLSDVDKYNLYMQQGAVYESQQNYEAAMESYRK